MSKPKRVLAVASGGGHWVQLLRLRPALADCSITFVTVSPAYEADVAGCRFRVVRDATRWSKLSLIVLAVQMAWTVIRERPDFVISTGAAPGYFAIRFARWLGVRTIWIDSIANVEKLSMSGRMVGRYADLWLTQWSHLARPEGPYYVGSVL